LIILEGPNLCGKTTAGMMLRERLGNFSYRHTTRPMVSPVNYRLWQLADSHPRMIVDRCHWSDFAFAHGAGFLDAPVGLDMIGWDRHHWRFIELAFMARGAHVLCFGDTPAGILSRWGDGVRQVHSRPSEEELTRLLGRYSFLLNSSMLEDTEGMEWERSAFVSRLPSMSLDLPSFQDGRWFDEFCRFAFRRAEMVEMALPPSMGVGSVDAEFMLIADDLEPGPPIGVTDKDPQGSVPDMPLYRGWGDLWAAIDLWRVQWWKGYYTTAAAFQDDPRQFAAYCSRVMRGCGTFVALGERSTELIAAALGSPGEWGHQAFRLRPDDREVGLSNICEHVLAGWRVNTGELLHRDRVARLWQPGDPE
jgi:hypothetical protein